VKSLAQVRTLLTKAKEINHPWFPVWAFAISTGMRSGELFALKWSSIDLDNKLIRVYESYAWRKKKAKSTKAGYWRNVPISTQLLKLIIELKGLTGQSEFVLPRVNGWEDGYAAKHLRDFLKRYGIDEYVVFHTLRACLATHLLASGAEPAKVMKIGGWKDLKTFEIYIRLAGVDVVGVTEKLKVLPTEAAILNHVRDLYDLSS
jgi:integrase